MIANRGEIKRERGCGLAYTTTLTILMARPSVMAMIASCVWMCEWKVSRSCRGQDVRGERG